MKDKLKIAADAPFFDIRDSFVKIIQIHKSNSFILYRLIYLNLNSWKNQLLRINYTICTKSFITVYSFYTKLRKSFKKGLKT